MTAHPFTLDSWVRWRSEASRQFDGLRRVPRHVRDELVQEALLRLLQAGEVANPGGWLRRVVRRLAIDWIRSEFSSGRCKWERWAQAEQQQTDPRPQLLERIAAGQVLELLAQAPPLHQQVLEQLYLRRVPVTALALELCSERGQRPEGTHLQSAGRTVRLQRQAALRWFREQLGAGEAP